MRGHRDAAHPQAAGGHLLPRGRGVALVAHRHRARLGDMRHVGLGDLHPQGRARRRRPGRGVDEPQPRVAAVRVAGRRGRGAARVRPIGRGVALPVARRHLRALPGGRGSQVGGARDRGGVHRLRAQAGRRDRVRRRGVLPRTPTRGSRGPSARSSAGRRGSAASRTSGATSPTAAAGRATGRRPRRRSGRRSARRTRRSSGRATGARPSCSEGPTPAARSCSRTRRRARWPTSPSRASTATGSARTTSRSA